MPRLNGCTWVFLRSTCMLDSLLLAPSYLALDENWLGASPVALSAAAFSLKEVVARGDLSTLICWLGPTPPWRWLKISRFTFTPFI